MKRTMPNKATLNTFIRFGIMQIGIKGYSAKASENKTSFKGLSGCCKAPRKQHYTCSACGKDVLNEDVVKGFELEKPRKSNNDKGKYIEFSKEEIGALKKSRDNIEVIDYCKKADIDDVFYDEKIYYLAPSKGSEYVFNLFMQALGSKNVVAIAKAVLSTQERFMMIESYQGCLKIQVLKYFEEVRLPVEIEPMEVKKEELNLAISLIEKQTQGFNLAEYENEYEAMIEKLVAKRLNGEVIEIEIPKPVAESKQVNVMDELKASLQLVTV